MKLWDPIRNLWVADTPEEQVRQRLIQKMIGMRGYPRGLIAVEKDLSSLPRRPDLLCFVLRKEKLVPLLLVECKAIRVSAKAERQALGYNETVGAPFICLASGKGEKTLWREEGGIASIPFLPAYDELVKKYEDFLASP